MATITRTARYTDRTKPYDDSVDIDSHVPEPFPVDAVHQYRLEQTVPQSTQVNSSKHLIDVHGDSETNQEGPSRITPIDTTFVDRQDEVSR